MARTVSHRPPLVERVAWKINFLFVKYFASPNKINSPLVRMKGGKKKLGRQVRVLETSDVARYGDQINDPFSTLLHSCCIDSASNMTCYNQKIPKQFISQQQALALKSSILSCRPRHSLRDFPCVSYGVCRKGRACQNGSERWFGLFCLSHSFHSHSLNPISFSTTHWKLRTTVLVSGPLMFLRLLENPSLSLSVSTSGKSTNTQVIMNDLD